MDNTILKLLKVLVFLCCLAMVAMFISVVIDLVCAITLLQQL